MESHLWHGKQEQIRQHYHYVGLISMIKQK